MALHRSLSGALALCVITWLGLPGPLFAASATGWFGTYTIDAGASTGSRGIYSFQWDSDTASFSAIQPVADAINPSFLALHPNGRFLYAVNEEVSSTEPGHVTAYAIGAAGAAEPLKSLDSVSSMGQSPCHLSVDTTGHWLFVANYTNGIIALYPIRADGSLGEAVQSIQQQGSGPIADRQRGAHAHEVVQSPDGRFLLVPDLGADRIFIYRFDAAAGKLSPNEPAAVSFPGGYGPRHLVFSSDGHLVYAISELNPAITTLRWNARRGSLARLAAISTLPRGFTGQRSAAEIALSPNGRFLYASNRGDSNTIAIFRIGPTGLPVPAGRVPSGGVTPRYFGVDPSGQFLITANQGSGDLFVFRIDPASGALKREGAAVKLPGPVDIVFASAPRG
jgi:6-phosphogluconolactonase